MWREKGAWNYAPGNTIFNGPPGSEWGPDLDEDLVADLRSQWRLREHSTFEQEEHASSSDPPPPLQKGKIPQGRQVTSGRTRPRARMKYQHRTCRGNFNIHAPGLNHSGGILPHVGLAFVNEHSDDFHLMSYGSTLAPRDQSGSGPVAKVAQCHDKQGQALTALFESLERGLDWVDILGACAAPWQEAPPNSGLSEAAMPAHLLPPR